MTQKWNSRKTSLYTDQRHKIILKFPVVKAACQGTETLTFWGPKPRNASTGVLPYVYIWYIANWDVLPDGLYHQIGSITIALSGLGVLESRIRIWKPSKYENPQWKSWASKTSITCNEESQFLNFLSGGSRKTSRKNFSGKESLGLLAVVCEGFGSFPSWRVCQRFFV